MVSLLGFNQAAGVMLLFGQGCQAIHFRGRVGRAARGRGGRRLRYDPLGRDRLIATLQRIPQRAELRLVATPALQRAAINRLADLNVAQRGDRPLGFVEAQATIIPRQAAKVEQPASLLLEIVDDVLVAHIEHAAGWQQPRANGPSVGYSRDNSALARPDRN